MKFNECIGDHVDVRTLRNFNLFISFLSLVGWLMILYINYSVVFSWEIGDWIISPYLVLVLIAIYQILSYPMTNAIDDVIQIRQDQKFKPRFTFQKMMTLFVLVGMTLYLSLIGHNFYKKKDPSHSIEVSLQSMMDFNTLLSKGCTLSGHKIKYDLYLNPVIVSDKKDTASDYSRYFNNQLSISKKPVTYKCATGERVVAFSLYRPFLK